MDRKYKYKKIELYENQSRNYQGLYRDKLFMTD